MFGWKERTVGKKVRKKRYSGKKERKVGKKERKGESQVGKKGWK